jgi:hypothetical protein
MTIVYCRFLTDTDSVVRSTTVGVSKATSVASNCSRYLTRITKTETVFSPVYVRYVGPTGLQHRISFGVGNRENPRALM